MKKYQCGIVFFLFICVFSLNAREENIGEYDDFSFGLTVGLMNKDMTFEINDTISNSAGSNFYKAHFRDTGNFPYVRIASNDTLNRPVNDWHLIIEVGYSEFELSKQRDAKDNQVDLGTSVSGKYYYVMPVLLYKSVVHTKHVIKLGLGAGLGRLNASGTAIYDFYGDKTTIHSISVNEKGYVFSGFVEYELSGFYIGFRGFTTSVEGVDDTNEGTQYKLLEYGVNAGYTLYF